MIKDSNLNFFYFHLIHFTTFFLTCNSFSIFLLSDIFVFNYNKPTKNDYWILSEPYLNYVQRKFIFHIFVRKVLNRFLVCPRRCEIELFFRWIIVGGQMYRNIKYGVVMAIENSMLYLGPKFSFFQCKFPFWPLNFYRSKLYLSIIAIIQITTKYWSIEVLTTYEHMILYLMTFFFTYACFFIHVPTFLLTQSWNYLLHHCECPIHIIYTFVIHKRPFSFVRSMSSIHSLTLKIGSSFPQ